MNKKLKYVAAGIAIGIALFFGAGNKALNAQTQGSDAEASRAAPTSREEALMDQARRTLLVRGHEYCYANECDEKEMAQHMQILMDEFDFWVNTLRNMTQYRNKDIRLVINDALKNSYDAFTSRHRSRPLASDDNKSTGR